MEIEEFGYKQELKRSLTLTDLVVYGMIFMIPIAPFGVYGYVNAEAPGMVPLAYIIGMVAMLFTALSYGSMAKAFPVAGSVYSYAQRGLNQHVGFIAGWLMLLDSLGDHDFTSEEETTLSVHLKQVSRIYENSALRGSLQSRAFDEGRRKGGCDHLIDQQTNHCRATLLHRCLARIAQFGGHRLHPRPRGIRNPGIGHTVQHQ